MAGPRVSAVRNAGRMIVARRFNGVKENIKQAISPQGTTELACRSDIVIAGFVCRQR